jgi:hypothetical protein
MWIHALIVLVGLAQNSIGDRDAAAIGAAKRVLVQAVDPALPRVSFDTWLRGIVGAEATTQWEVNASVDTSNPAIDRRVKPGHFWPAPETSGVLLRGRLGAQVGVDFGAPAPWPTFEHVRVM